MSGFSLHINCGGGVAGAQRGSRGSSAPAPAPTAALQTGALTPLSASLLAAPRPSPRPQKEVGVFQRSKGEGAQGQGREARERVLLRRRSSAMARLGAKRPRWSRGSALPPARLSCRALPKGPPPRGGTRLGSVASSAPPK